MARFDWAESSSTRLDEEARVAESRFGDGYAQRAPAGLNSLDESWSVNLRAVSRSAGDEIIAFFRTHRGVTPFDWTPPFTSVSGRWVCKRWTRTALDEADTSDITAVFERVYEP